MTVRVLLVVNPRATAADVTTTRRVSTLLADVAKVDVEHTDHRGHARELAAAARAEGLDAVIAFGGDGTVSEVAGGLLTQGPGADVPSLGVLPGGGTNVLARTLGLPRTAVPAAKALAAGLAAGRSRRIGMGRLAVLEGEPGAPADRWFILNVGLGLDAEAIARVESARLRGRRAGHLRYAASTLRAWSAGDRSHPALTVRGPGGQTSGLATAIVTNTDPWSYLGPRRLRPTPASSFDHGLDVFAPRSLTATSTLTSVGRMLTHRPGRERGSWSAHDLPWLEVSTSGEVALQADGDYLGLVRGVRLTSVRGALRVLAPGS